MKTTRKLKNNNCEHNSSEAIANKHIEEPAQATKKHVTQSLTVMEPEEKSQVKQTLSSTVLKQLTPCDETSSLSSNTSSFLSPAFKFNQSESRAAIQNANQSIISLSSDDSTAKSLETTSDTQELSLNLSVDQEIESNDKGEANQSEQFAMTGQSTRVADQKAVRFASFNFTDDSIQEGDNSIIDDPLDQLESEFSRLSTVSRQSPSLSLPKMDRLSRKARDSLDCLLDDISKHLLTPVSTPASRRILKAHEKFDDSDVILTGYMTPATTGHHPDTYMSIQSPYTSYVESDTSIPLFTVKSFSLPDSDISLLETRVKSKTQLLDYDSNTGNLKPKGHITYGSFNVVPSFLESSSAEDNQELIL